MGFASARSPDLPAGDPSRILIVDDDRAIISVLGAILRDLGQIRFATSGAEALELVARNPPDVILLDIEMPGMSGFETCARLKENPALAAIPVIFITAADNPNFELTGLELGAVDFIPKPPRGPIVVARVKTQLRMKQLADELRRAATSDALTSLANRRLLDDHAGRAWRQALRTGAPLSFLIADIDAFKAFNDHYGHPAGDACLVHVARTLRDVAQRPLDLTARFGGEEFAILLPETDSVGAEQVATNLLDALDELRLPHAASPVADFVTISIGLSSYVAESPNTIHDSAAIRPLFADLVAAADQALYAAKRGGRHQACTLSLEDRHDPTRATRIVREPRSSPKVAHEATRHA